MFILGLDEFVDQASGVVEAHSAPLAASCQGEAHGNVCFAQTRRADQDSIPYQEFLLRLVRPQWHAKQEKALEWRIKNARLPERWTLVARDAFSGVELWRRPVGPGCCFPMTG